VDPEYAFRWMLDYNLKNLITFHNYMRSLLREKRNASDVQNDPASQFILEYYDKKNSVNTFLLAISFLEEMLILIWKRQMPNDPLPKGSSILRYEPLLKKLGLDLNNLPCWGVVKDAYLLRNCLLHANGRIHLMRNRAEIRSCIKRHEDVLDVKLEIIAISPLFLERCIYAIQELIEKMLIGVDSSVKCNKG